MLSFETTTSVKTRRAWLLIAGALATPGGVFAVCAFGPELLPACGLLLLSIVAQLALLFAFASFPQTHAARVRASGAGLEIDGLPLVRRRSIRAAHLRIRAGTRSVQLDRGSWPIALDVASDAEGRALIAALRLDPESTVVRYVFSAGSSDEEPLRLLETTAIVGLPLFFDLRLVVLTGLLGIAHQLNQRCNVRLGADALRVRRLLGRPRVVRYSEIERVEPSASDVVLVLRRGSELRFHVGGSNEWIERWLPAAKERREGFVGRLRERIAASTRHAASAEEERLARKGLKLDDWLGALRAAAATKGYRSPARPLELLWQIVRDPSAQSAARVGAAYSLRSDLDGEARARLARIAEACVEPEVRDALDRIARDADEAVVARALERVT